MPFMPRLRWRPNGRYVLLQSRGKGEIAMAKQKCAKCTINDNLTYQVDKLTEENAELKARLEKSVELPCEVGDSVQATVNRPYNGHDAIIRGAVTDVKLVVRVKYNSCRFINFLASDFGKTVFLTQEEAEQALKEREENE